MNITFILGNGFDIQLGLQSRYSDFLREYVKIDPHDDDSIAEFKQYLAQNLTQELWSDAEKGMGVYLGQFSDATIETYNERIEDFESKLAEYLKRQQDRCSYSESKKISERFKDFLFNSFADALASRGNELGIFKREDNTFRFISFNYTNLLENIKQCCISNSNTIRTRSVQGATCSDYWGKIIHVHGILDDQIIMGVNDESQLDLSGGVTPTDELRWELIKPILNQDSRNYDALAKKAISISDIIAIYGVSYGDTDKLWWEEIIDWLKQGEKHKLVLFVRDKPAPYNPILGWKELKYEKEKREEMLKKLGVAGSNPDFGILTEQMYIILNTTRLNLRELLIPPAPDDAVAASTNPSEPTTI